MNTVKDDLKEIVKQISPKLSDKDKEQCAQLLEGYLTGDGKLSEKLGMSSEMLNFLHNHAHRLYSSGKYNDASIIFAILTKVDKLNPKSYFGFAASHHMLKNYHYAMDAYNASFYLDQTNPMPFYHLADCCIKSGRPDLAISYLAYSIAVAGNQAQYAKVKERALMIQEGLRQELYQKSGK